MYSRHGLSITDTITNDAFNVDSILWSIKYNYCVIHENTDDAGSDGGG